MNFVADESVDYPIVLRLRQEKHSVWAVAEMEPSLVFRDKRYTFGVVLLRLAGLTAAEKAGVVATAINQYHEELENAFAVIGPRTVRIRPRLV